MVIERRPFPAVAMRITSPRTASSWRLAEARDCWLPCAGRTPDCVCATADCIARPISRTRIAIRFLRKSCDPLENGGSGEFAYATPVADGIQVTEQSRAKVKFLA